MTAEPIDLLLEKLNCGDDAAVEQVFRTYEPYLRMVVRRHLSSELRAKFDSMDVVQSVWIHVLKGFRQAGWCFPDAAHLRAFLVQLTQHRFIDRLRRHRRAIEVEQPITGLELEAALGDEPQPEHVIQADELWEQLLQLCPPVHRELLLMKRAGALTSEVAARTGLNEGSVRRILKTLAQRLASQERAKEEAALGTMRAHREKSLKNHVGERAFTSAVAVRLVAGNCQSADAITQRTKLTAHFGAIYRSADSWRTTRFPFIPAEAFMFWQSDRFLVRVGIALLLAMGITASTCSAQCQNGNQSSSTTTGTSTTSATTSGTTALQQRQVALATALQQTNAQLGLALRASSGQTNATVALLQQRQSLLQSALQQNATALASSARSNGTQGSQNAAFARAGGRPGRR